MRINRKSWHYHIAKYMFNDMVGNPEPSTTLGYWVDFVGGVILWAMFWWLLGPFELYQQYEQRTKRPEFF